MKRFNTYFLCNKILVNSQYRKIQTNIIQLSRSKKSVGHNNDTRSKKQWRLSDDTENKKFFENEEDEYNLDPDEINYMNLDKFYDEHVREKNFTKRKISAAIMKSKFFSGDKQPPMLTVEEREKIIFLHESDPVNWDVNTLSENFPGTPPIIQKILKTKWRPTPEKIKKIDENVRRNWELLEKGELKADPELIKHCKKFVNRRKVLYENISSSNFYLPEPKKEKEFNSNEFKNILVDYEKKLERLYASQKNLSNENSENNKNIINSSKEEESNLKKLRSQIKKEVECRGLEKKESFILGQAFKAVDENLTLEELKNNILRKADDKNLDLNEKAILENMLGSTHNYKDKSSVNQSCRTRKSVLNENNQKNEEYKEVFKKETEIKNDPTIFQSGHDIENNEQQSNSAQESYDEDLYHELPLPDERTIFISSENEIGKIINNCNNTEVTLLQSKSKTDEKIPKKKFHLEKTPEKIESQKVFFENQVEDIKNTAFWNNNSNNHDQNKLVEINKSSLCEPEKIPKMKQVDTYKPDMYPNRIKIPKSHRGSGYTFKVNDCYYDDDGEFLYRVPGMVN